MHNTCLTSVFFCTWGCFWLTRSRSQWYFMSIALSFFMTLLLTTPSAVVLSVCIGVGGWVCPKNSSVWRAEGQHHSTCTTVCIGYWQVRHITVSGKDHATGMICDNGVWVCGCIVKKLFYFCHHSVGCWVQLLRGEWSKGPGHSAVNASCIVEESAYDFFNVFFARLVQSRWCVAACCILFVCAVSWFDVQVGLWPKPSVLGY